MTRVAAIDCGTNSLRLLVADLAGGALAEIWRETRIVRLGHGVDRTGRLDAAALERTRAVLADYARISAEHGVERVRMIATSATRDAVNSAELVAIARVELGVDPEIVSGTDEAALTFAGASGVLADGPLLVADLGGGSTELVLGPQPLRAVSVDVGSVRMTERHLHTDPPTEEQIAAARADIRTALAEAAEQLPLRSADQLVGVAGTVTTFAAIALGLPHYDRAQVHGAQISAGQVRDVAERLLAMPHAERARIPVIQTGRVDVIAAGALLLHEIVVAADANSVVVSEHDILDGIALGME